MSENTDINSEIVILDVGGIKYKTFRSTLTAHPDTLLGTMFSDRNQQLLKPINGNEYFFDRNGRAFHYVMEYYRTGKLSLPSQLDNKTTEFWVTREEVEKELDYFLINNKFEQQYKEVQLTIAEHLRKLVAFLEQLLLNEMRSMVTVNILCKVYNSKIKIQNRIEYFSYGSETAFHLTKEFHPEISRHLKHKFSGSTITSQLKFDNSEYHVDFEMTLKYDKEFILGHSNLKVD
ncbi:11418_t:CDS:2 [Ambispora leptoticha]|uniref:11418_t:CDS:1 n=1 Tax=Ambispora leptoticha TaxID=144679 RepID=A0A9N9CYN8_9GLOM|nr:11418_t:CDS:2 [Ambispora leptoticha]